MENAHATGIELDGVVDVVHYSLYGFVGAHSAHVYLRAEIELSLTAGVARLRGDVRHASAAGGGAQMVRLRRFRRTVVRMLPKMTVASLPEIYSRLCLPWSSPSEKNDAVALHKRTLVLCRFCFCRLFLFAFGTLSRGCSLSAVLSSVARVSFELLPCRLGLFFVRLCAPDVAYGFFYAGIAAVEYAFGFFARVADDLPALLPELFHIVGISRQGFVELLLLAMDLVALFSPSSGGRGQCRADICPC